MTEEIIQLTIGGKTWISDRAAICAPESALDNQSHIRRIMAGQGSSGKHTAHALAQAAMVQHEDEELEIDWLEAGQGIRIEKSGESFDCERGLAMIWTGEGIRVFAHRDLPVSRFLKLVFRECTRWIRLDVH